MDFYPWIVFLHVLGAFGFVMGHGASAFVSIQLREERDRDRISALLNLSRQSLGLTYGSLLLLILAGIIAGFAGDWWGSLWLWAAIVLLMLMLAVMYGMATPYYRAIREAAGMRPIHAPESAPAPDASPDRLDTLLRDSRPMQIMGIGGIGLLLIIWLMVVKPF
jgi:MFS family permease